MNRSVRSLGSLAVAAALTTGTLALAPASQAARSAPSPEVIVTSTDARNDVRILPGKHLTHREKKSIDIRRVTLGRVGNRARIIITMRETIRTNKFDQMIHLELQERPGRSDGWATQAGVTTKARMSYATYYAPDYGESINCGVAVKVRPKKRQVVATIPSACTPDDWFRLKVLTSTGTFRSDEPSYSFDGHRVPGLHRVL